MGAVWIADHTTLRTEVVVKFLLNRLLDDPTSQARFTREASAAAQVKSPHVVQILDHGVLHGNRPYIVMELLEGRDLSAQLKLRGALEPHEVAHLVEHVALALQRAHIKGIVHRDIKPNNIFLCDVGASQPFIKLLDFGIASDSQLEHLTATGQIVGTPAFMSPEQLSGKEVTPKSDLWSLGMVALKALTGQNPFQRGNIHETMGAVMHAPRPVPSQLAPHLPHALDDWFARACHRQPECRWRNATEMSRALWAALGVERQIASSPSASLVPLPLAQETTVAETPPELVTEGTLRSTVNERPALTEPSASTPAPPPRRRALGWGIGAGVIVLGLLAAVGLSVTSVSDAVPLLRRGTASLAVLVRSQVDAIRPPPAPLGSNSAPVNAATKAKKPTSAPTSTSRKRPPPTSAVPTARPKNPNDDSLGF